MASLQEEETCFVMSSDSQIADQTSPPGSPTVKLLLKGSVTPGPTGSMNTSDVSFHSS